MHDDLVLGQLCRWAESTWPAVGTVDTVGVANNNALFVTFLGHAKQIEIYWSQFSMISTDSLCLWVPRSRDLTTFVPTTDKTHNWSLYPCTCMQGNEGKMSLTTLLKSSSSAGENLEDILAAASGLRLTNPHQRAGLSSILAWATSRFKGRSWRLIVERKVEKSSSGRSARS